MDGTPTPALQVSDSERRRRWRLVLGGVPDDDGEGLARIDAHADAIYGLNAWPAPVVE